MALGAKVHIGYYDQEHQVLHMEKTIFEEISDAYPSMTQTEIRNVLAAFLFTGDEVFQPISTLSGGERGRVSLAKLMLSEANFLILDEPTNHLDIVSKEILEDALREYTGTVLYVSHDRYFINRTATRILELTGETLVNYIGNYDYYLEKKEELTKAYVPSANAGVSCRRLQRTGTARRIRRPAGLEGTEGSSGPASEKKKTICVSWKKGLPLLKSATGPSTKNSTCRRQARTCPGVRPCPEKRRKSLKNWRGFTKNGSCWRSKIPVRRADRKSR